jgi:fructose-1,6-bisphosphatase/inositol monophosphatase family enzyme
MTNPLSDNIKTYIKARDGYLCQYCEGASGDNDLTVHHLQARSEGGSNETSNLITACQTCHDRINNGWRKMNHRSSTELSEKKLDSYELWQLQKRVRKLLLGEIKDTIMSARQESAQITEPSPDSEQAKAIYAAIGETLATSLRALIPLSLVVDEESFATSGGGLHTPWILADLKQRRYSWVIRPLDGMAAFLSPTHPNYSLAITLLENLAPIFSFVYAPEFVINDKVGALFEANCDGAFLNDRVFSIGENASSFHCVSHLLHKAKNMNLFEISIAKLCATTEIIFNDDHSPLLQACLVATSDGTSVFVKQKPHVLKTVAGAHIAEQAGSIALFYDGQQMLPPNSTLAALGEKTLRYQQMLVCNKSFVDSFAQKTAPKT